MSVAFMATVAFYPKSVIRLPPYFVLLSGRLFSSFSRCSGLHREKEESKMTMAVRKTDEELTDKRKCKIGGLMTDLGLLVLVGIISFLHSLRVAAFLFFLQR